MVVAVFIFSVHGLMHTIDLTCDHAREENILEGRKHKCIIMHLLGPAI
jgi:hypothetical protein